MPGSKQSNKKNSNPSKKETHKRIKRIRLNVARANQCENPLSSSFINDDKNYSSDLSTNIELQLFPQPSDSGQGQQVQGMMCKGCIHFHKYPLKDSILESCLALFQANMKEMYKQSSWGFNMEEKRQELSHMHARYLVVTRRKEDNCTTIDQDQVLAFTHFRFEVDDDDEPTQEVLYLYEIQIDPMVQRNGLGRRIMHLIELIAKEMNMKKVMLTVFKHNESAMRFYERLDYTIDVTSPSQFGENADYEILSKIVSNDG